MNADLTISPTMLLIVVSIVGMIATFINVWVMLRIRADVAELKLWAVDRFVSKEELRASIASYQRSAQQLTESYSRVDQRTRPQ